MGWVLRLCMAPIELPHVRFFRTNDAPVDALTEPPAILERTLRPPSLLRTVRVCSCPEGRSLAVNIATRSTGSLSSA
jgi:hypothetical protein